MVMKATQRTYLLKTIRKNIVSFFAVALMVATGVSIYLGDQSSALAILSRADQYFKENQLHSLEVSSVYGITEEYTGKCFGDNARNTRILYCNRSMLS